MPAPVLVQRPSRAEAEAAVTTLLRWAGDDPKREGLIDTPGRVVRAFEEYFQGYNEDPAEVLRSASYDHAGYEDFVLLRNIPFESHCEHHIAPIIGSVSVAYLPNTRVVGISKLVRVCEVFAKRLQIQEKMTAEIAEAINVGLKPRGVAVVIVAEHQCMTTRGVHKKGLSMTSRAFLGEFKDNEVLRREFLTALQ
ncbi:MAG: GTP cyclohydrolase I FolE [Holosporales bacterium]|jgi:GTP cyclohydrolase I